MQYQNQRDMKTFVQITFWMSLLLLFVVAQSVLGSSGSITAPSSVIEGDLLSIDFSSDDPNATLELQKDGSPVANSPPYEWQTTHQDAGLYTLTLYADAVQLDEVTVEVIDKPLSFSVIEPSETDYAQSTIPIHLETESMVDFCYYIIGAESNTLDSNGNTHIGEFTRPDGVYTVALKCKLGTEVSTQEKTLLIDTTPPSILSFSPTQGGTIQGTSTTISVTTNEIATCTLRAATSNDEQPMTTGDYLTHTRTVSPNQGTHNYYVTCTDTHDNENTLQQLSFTLEQAPTAKIFIEEREEEDTPLVAGSYMITVETSEPVTDDITLTYEYQTGNGGSVALSKNDASGTEWRGYLVLESTVGEKAGNFVLSMKDTTGNTGTTITQGKLFLVDTLAPDPPQGLTVKQEDDTIELSWQEKEGVQYEIYRATKQSVTESDFFAKTQSGEYVDTQTQPNEIYYYAVLGIDEAGNRGELSASVGTLRTALANPTSIPEGQAYDAQKMTERVDKIIIDLDAAYTLLETEKDEKKLLFIRELQLLETLQKEKKAFEVVRTELETLSSRSSEHFQQRIAQINQEIGEARNTIPARITIDGNIQFQQPTDIAIQNRLLEIAALNLGISDKEAYRASMERLMPEVDVRGEVTTATILYSDRAEKQFTHVTQELSFPAQMNPTQLFINIPKELAKSAKDLVFTPTPVVVEEDPILRFTIPKGQSRFEYSFMLAEGRDLATARSLRNVLFPEPAENTPTGYVTAGSFDMEGFFTNNYLYVLAGIVIILLFFYYQTMDSGPSRSDEFFATLTKKLESMNTSTGQKSLYPPPQFFQRRKIRRPTQTSIFPAQTPLPARPVNTFLNRELSSVLRDAHQAIDDTQYIDARDAYKHAVARSEMASQEEKAAMSLLHKKLLLYQEIQAASTAAQEQDIERLKQKLDSALIVAKKIPETESKLIIGAKEQYGALRKAENKLLITNDVF